MYDLEWCAHVLEEFEKEYPEASKSVRIVCKVDKASIILSISNDQSQWRLYKKLVKFRHNFEAADAQLELMALQYNDPDQ